MNPTTSTQETTAPVIEDAIVPTVMANENGTLPATTPHRYIIKENDDLFLLFSENPSDVSINGTIYKKEKSHQKNNEGASSTETEHCVQSVHLTTEPTSDDNPDTNDDIQKYFSDSSVIVCSNEDKIIDLTLEKASELVHSSNVFRTEYCEDGTVIRLYFHNNKWNTATTKCLDARNSFWSSHKTFDELFWEVFDPLYLSTLDTKCTYIFILLHTENRIVARHKFNCLTFISCINNETGTISYKNIFKDSKNIKRPLIINDDPKKIVQNFRTYFKPQKRGILFKVKDPKTSAITTYKLDFEEYAVVKKIRGNVPQIRMRYLELLNDAESSKLLKYYFNESKFVFDFVEHSLVNLSKEIHQLYMDSHVKHTIKIDETHPFHRTLRQLHAQYKTTNQPITKQAVRDKLNSLDKYALKTLLGWV